MEVILLKDVEKLGTANEIVKVRPGFGRNYLIPRGLALFATESNKKMVNENMRQREQKEMKLVDAFREIAAKLEKSSVKVGAKVGTSGKIFGSVTSHQLADSIKNQLDIDVDRRNIEITDEVKAAGTYLARISLHRNVTCEINFDVVPE